MTSSLKVVLDNRKKNPNLLVFTGSFDKGGAERRTMSLVRFLYSKGYKVHIGSFSSTNHSDSMKKPQYSSLTKLGKRGFIPIIPVIKVIRLLFAKKPTIVFSNLRRVNIVLMLVKMILRSDKIIFTLGVSNNPEHHPNPLFTRILYKKANFLVSNSRGIKNYLCNKWGLKKHDVHVIKNGLDEKKISSLSKQDCSLTWYQEPLPIIITIGRLSTQKNQASLIKAFSLFRRKHESRLVIIGEGPLLQRLEELSRDLSVYEHTWFAGFQSNPYKFLARSTVFVLSSKWEGFPNVILEAMTCGVPVISTDIDYGPKEIIDNGENGFLVPDNDVEALAAKIQFVLENKNKDFIKAIIENAKAKVRSQFTINEMLKNYHKFFLSVHN